ncbi:MAG: hypothetical protein LBE50_06375, partial [Gallionellaceae bacterium]|nr:hypothetical protein [Gallionellaceae bacterium]
DVSKFYNGKVATTTAGKGLEQATGGQDPKTFLIKKVSLGGGGNWGSVRMSANDPLPHDHPKAEGETGVKQADIDRIVTWILDLEK